MSAVKIVSYPYESPDRSRAAGAFRALLEGNTRADDMLHFTGQVFDRCFAFAGKHDFTIAVHSGVWGAFRQSHPCHLISLAQTYPDNRFDLFHLGMPFVREAVMIGKMFPTSSPSLPTPSGTSFRKLQMESTMVDSENARRHPWPGRVRSQILGRSSSGYRRQGSGRSVLGAVILHEVLQ